MKSYILLTYDGSARHVFINRNDYETRLLDKKKLEGDPSTLIAEAQFEAIRLRDEVFELKQEILSNQRLIRRLKYKTQVNQTYHWRSGCSCTPPVYGELAYSNDIQFVNCEPCRLRANQQERERDVRMKHTPII